MSRVPNASCYGYPAPTMPPEYYYDEAEDYVEDYSESDGLSDPHPQAQPQPSLHQQSQHRQCHRAHHRLPPHSTDVTEIYRRKSIMPGPPVTIPEHRFSQHQQAYVPEYYYEPQHVQPTHVVQSPPPTRRITVAPFSQSMSVVEPRLAQPNYYSRALQPPDIYENTYRSSPQISPNVRMYADCAPSASLERTSRSKRYPVTVRTPRYYRRVGSSTLYKRPSALCLPVASQPDPAVSKRPKRIPVLPMPLHETDQYRYNPPVSSKAYSTGSIDLKSNTQSVHKMDSEGDVDQRISHLEEMLDKFEKEAETDVVESSSRSDMAKIAKYLKPRLPPSLKHKQQQNKKVSVYEAVDADPIGKESSNDKPNASTMLEVQEITADSLERLLNQLKKCELSSSKDHLREKECYDDKSEKDDQDLDDNQADGQNTPSKPEPKQTPSFNYQDISRQILHNHDDSSQSSLQNVKLPKMMRRSCNRDDQAEGSRSTSRLKSTSAFPRPAPPPLDDHCALELHRSKSYIVNLIDRALSKELGTVPAEKCDKNHFEHMSTKKAIDMVNRHSCGKSVSNDTCAEISPNLTETLTAAPSCRANETSKSSQVCICNNEPLYIKQLKQLRWGHLRHIQREVRRLEDLERFLDTCTTTTQQEGGRY